MPCLVVLIILIVLLGLLLFAPGVGIFALIGGTVFVKLVADNFWTIFWVGVLSIAFMWFLHKTLGKHLDAHERGDGGLSQDDT